MTVDIGKFRGAEDEFALRLKREDLPGLLRKKLEVPEGVLALVRTDGDAQVLEAGGESSDLADALLVKRACTIDVRIEAGHSQDDLPFEVSLGLALATRAGKIDLEQLEQALVGDQPLVVRGQVQEYFLPYLRDAVRFFVSQREAAKLVDDDQRAALEDHLRQQLEKALFEGGFELTAVRHPSFRSQAYEDRRKARADAAGQAESLEREQQLLALKKQLDMAALLKDIEVQDEADRTRKEKRLERYEDIRSRMGDDDVKALIMMLDDDAQRARLIRELIDKEATDEQKASMQVTEMEDALQARLAEVQAKLSQLSGLAMERNADDPITRRLLCVVGKRVLAFDPKTNLHPEVPKEVYDTETGSLGYLRSARWETIDGEGWLLAGAQRGIYRLREGELIEYPYPSEPEGKGGANAVAYFDGRLFATHSEAGLTEWSLAKSGEGAECRTLCEAVTSGASATRGAVVVDGVLYFSAGNAVYGLDLATGTDRPVQYRGSDDSVTSFLVFDGELVAGNRSGKMYRWHLDDPGSAESFGVVKKNPIYMLRHTPIAGQGFFVIGSKEFTVTAAEPKKDLFREYQAREEVRWVDGASDFIFGVSRSGYKVFCWDTFQQGEPKLTIRVSDKVQDLFTVRQLPRA